jgi:DNA polymerase V
MHDDLQTLANSDGVTVHSGFPNPGLEHRGQGSERLSLDLNQLLIRHSASTYLYRVAGHHWADQGIFDGDVAVIDRALQAKPTDLLITWRPDGSTILRQRQLTPEDQPWGVVTAIIHQYRP